jgi:hypothetical protein
VSYETIRQWCQKFGPDYARKLKRREGRLGDHWHLDEVFIRINGQQQYLWRAVDQDGDVIDILVQPHRDQRAAERFFRRLFGIAADLFCGVILIFLTLALYRVFKGVDQGLAVMMVIVGGVLPSAIDFFNVLNDAAALMLVRGADFLAVFDKPQRDALAILFLRLHRQQIVAAEVLWGLWLFPFGILTIRSGFLPRFLGYWLIINGFAYLALSFSGIFLPQYEHMLSNITFPAILGEMAFMLWLLIKGAKPQPLAAPAA